MQERHSINKQDVVQIIKDTVKFNRGFGETGEQEMVLEFSDTDLSKDGYSTDNCPHCGYDRVIAIDVRNPELPTPFEYECANQHCNWSDVEQFSEEFIEKWC